MRLQTAASPPPTCARRLIAAAGLALALVGFAVPALFGTGALAQTPPPTNLSPPGTAAPETTAEQVFETAMRAWMAGHRVSRGSLAVMREGRLVYAAGFGGRRAADRVPLWGLSKPITAACIATFVQEGRIAFDDPIGPLIAPLFASIGRLNDERLPLVTIEQLLAHRSGLPTWFAGGEFRPEVQRVLRRIPSRDVSARDLVQRTLRLSLKYAPGTRHLFSHGGYLLLGEVIEAVADAPYDKVCGERVLARAGIRGPALDRDWGQLLQATGGWALSPPRISRLPARVPGRRQCRPRARDDCLGAANERPLAR